MSLLALRQFTAETSGTGTVLTIGGKFAVVCNQTQEDAVLECWSVGVLEYWSIGVLEYWSIGVLESAAEPAIAALV